MSAPSARESRVHNRRRRIGISSLREWPTVPRPPSPSARADISSLCVWQKARCLPISRPEFSGSNRGEECRIGRTVVDTYKGLFHRKPEAIEYLAVTGTRGDEREHHLVARTCQSALMHTPLPYRVHSDLRATAPTWISYSCEAPRGDRPPHLYHTLLQLCEQTPQSVGMRIFGFEINAEHNQIGRRIDKERRLRLLGQKYEPVAGLLRHTE